MPISEKPFASSRLKIDRAKEHLEILKGEIRIWVQSKPLNIIKESDEVGRNFTVFVEMLEQPPRNRWALISGDCMHNLRSSLDNLVYDIAIIETRVNPPIDEKKLLFPIGRCLEDFENQEWRIKSLSPTTKAILERAQPYNHPHLELPPILDLLNTLNNENKHRMLSIVAVSPQSVSVEVVGASPSKIEVIHTIIEGKTKIQSFMMEPPTPNLEYKCGGVFPICILHDAGPSKSPMNDLVSVLHLMIEEVERITKTLTDLFDDMADLPQVTNFRLENRKAIFHFPANLPDGE